MESTKKTTSARRRALRVAMAVALVISTMAPTLTLQAEKAYAATESISQLTWDEAKPEIESYMGVPYVWAGRSTSGWDCSGFVSYVYAQMGISLPHQSGDILNSGTVISASEARPGDILWWPGHVGIYAGDGQVLHSTPGVSITNIWGSPTYLRVG